MYYINYFLKILHPFININKYYKISFIIIIEIILSFFAFFISLFLIHDYNLYSLILTFNEPIFLISFFFIIWFSFFGFYSSFFRFISFVIVFKLILVHLFNITSIILFIYLFQIDNYNINFLILYLLIFFNLIFLFRYSIYKFIKFFNNSQFNKITVAIYGTDEISYEFIRLSERYKINCFIENERVNRKILDIDIVTLDDFLNENKFKNVEMIIIAKKNLNHFQLEEIYKKFENINIPIKNFNNFENIDKNFNQDFLDYSLHKLINRNIKFNTEALKNKIFNKTILITGGAGSIGSELTKQIIFFKPKKIIVVDNSEYNIYNLKNYLVNVQNISYYLTSLLNYNKIKKIIKTEKPNFVFHAAAYKHVNILEFEENIDSAIENNVFGTFNLLEVLNIYGCDEFVLISSDKAVKPTNVMGQTKRLCELFSMHYEKYKKIKKCSIVRFGNVMGSAGSVIPLFNYQIKNRLPLTITHSDATRYFMTVEEAVGLVLESTLQNNSSSIFMLKMGKPIKIEEIAKKLIKLHGLQVGKVNDKNSISIKYIGLSKGEKLHEDLFDSKKYFSTSHGDIFTMREIINNNIDIKEVIEEFKNLIKSADNSKLRVYLNKTCQ